MRIPTLIIALATPVIAGGCATTSPQEPVTTMPEQGRCNAAAVQDYVGKQANVANGTAIRDASGARRLRWGAPDSVWTMDYRLDRVNVRYDKDMMITEITCG